MPCLEYTCSRCDAHWFSILKYDECFECGSKELLKEDSDVTVKDREVAGTGKNEFNDVPVSQDT